MKTYVCSACKCEFRSKVLSCNNEDRTRIDTEGFCCPSCGVRHKSKILNNDDLLKIMTQLEEIAEDSVLFKMFGFNKTSLQQSIKFYSEKWNSNAN